MKENLSLKLEKITSVERLHSQRIVIPLFFFSSAVLLTWPLFFQPDQLYLSGTGSWGHTAIPEDSDTLIHMDAVRASSDRLLDGKSPLDVRPNYALPQTYVVVGAVLTTVLPISVVVFHNMFFLASLILAGYFQYLFVNEMLENRKVSILSGFLYMSSFFVFHTYVWGHTNQWQIQWIPLILLGMEKIRTSGRLRFVGLLGVALAVQVLSSVQYSVYLTFFLPVYMFVRFGGDLYVQGRTYEATNPFSDSADFEAGNPNPLEGEHLLYRLRQFLTKFGAAVVLAVLVTSPYLLVRYSMSDVTPTYTLAENAISYWVIDDIFEIFWAHKSPAQFWYRLVLFTAGISAIVFLKSERKTQLAPFVVFFVVGTALGVGPFTRWAPYALFHQHWPLVDYFKVPQRVFPFIAIGSSVLSASFLRYLQVFDDKPDPDRARSVAIIIVLLVILQVAIVHVELGFQPLP